MTTSQAALPALRWWNITTALVLVVMTVIGVLVGLADAPLWMTDAPQGARIALLLSSVAAIGMTYLLFGRGPLCRGMFDHPIGASGRFYLVMLLLVVGFAVSLEPTFAIAQAIVFPMAWSLCERYMEAVLWSALIALTLGVAMFAGLASTDAESALVTALYSAPLSFAFAVAMGTWITRIFQQGERYRQLAALLQESQSTVAQLSEAAGAAAERDRLSRELHDTLTQTLTGLVMLSEQAKRSLEIHDTARAQDRIERVSSAAREAVAEARALVATTQPLAEGGLIASLKRVADRLAADTGMRVDCELESIPLTRESEVILLRTAQEGLANARKHARATRVLISLTSSKNHQATLTVDDDGVGVALAASADHAISRGFGLSGLADRVQAVGGEVVFGTGALGGARLEVRLPLSWSTAQTHEQNR